MEIAERFDAAIQPFRAILVPPEFPPAAGGSRRDPLPEHLLKEATDDLLRLARPRRGVDVRGPMVRLGQPWEAILKASEELGVNLIVLGSHGYQRLDRLLGTTAARVVNHARRDVLVVHARPSQAMAPYPASEVS